jgi:hypothetical protein
MRATSRLLIAGLAVLAPAHAAPALAVAEAGEDFRVSAMAGLGDPSVDALDPEVAHNPFADEYLVVWSADDIAPGLAANKIEIYGQRVAGDGALLGPRVRVSFTGADGTATQDALYPSVAFNPVVGEYFVVWSANPGTGGMATFEREVFGQRLAASTLAPLGAVKRLSQLDGTGTESTAANPCVVFDPERNQYLVVWDTNSDSTAGVFGQRVDGTTGNEIGADDFRITPVAAGWPRAAYNPTVDELLVVWTAVDAATSPPELEIFGQRLAAANGAELGLNDFRISEMGPPNDTDFSAVYADVAYAADVGEYLVVWSGEDDTLAPLELEIFGQRLDGTTGTEVGEDDARLTAFGGIGDVEYRAGTAMVAYNPRDRAWVVVAWAIGDQDGQQPGEFEIFALEVDATTGVAGAAQRISDAGGLGDFDYDAEWPAVAANPGRNELLVVWQAADGEDGQALDELEIFGQRLAGTALFSDGFESGTTLAWSSRAP